MIKRELQTVFALITATSLLLVGSGVCSAEPAPQHHWDTTSEAGLYRISAGPIDGAIPLNRTHSWHVQLQDSEGHAFQPKQLAIYGGMKAHGHGLPSTPRVTQEVEQGTYLVEGMLFTMYGSWELVIGVVGPDGPDKATIKLDLQPPAANDQPIDDWSVAELALMRSLALASLSDHRLDESNRFDGNEMAIALGKELFSDTGLSRNDDIACSSCHLPELMYTDGKKKSFGSKELARNSQTLLGISQHKWFYWDGRRDSLWSQALTPIETNGEMDSTRSATVFYLLSHESYAPQLRQLVGDLPAKTEIPENAGPYGTPLEKEVWAALPASRKHEINTVFASVGKIIASYVATLQPSASRFDEFVGDVGAGKSGSEKLSAAEQRGLRLFLDAEKTQCLRCHNGPNFSNGDFNNIGTGLGEDGDLPDFGRLMGLRAALNDEFNCVGRYSDAGPAGCPHHTFASQGHADGGAFKVPTLRNVSMTGPYMHDGRFDDLASVLDFYRDPPPRELSNHELPPLDLTDEELLDLEKFLRALKSESAALTK